MSTLVDLPLTEEKIIQMVPNGRDRLRVPDGFWERDDVRQALCERDVGGLFRLLQRHGASQTRIGSAVGLEQGYVSKVKNGHRRIKTIEVLERVAEGLEMPDHCRKLLGLKISGHVWRHDIARVAPGGVTGRDDSRLIEPARAAPPMLPVADLPIEKEEMRRRRFLSAAGGSIAGAALPVDLAGQALTSRGLTSLAMSVLRAAVSADPEHSSQLDYVPPLQALDERVKKIRLSRVACDYPAALSLIPETIRGLHARLSMPDWRSAARSLVLVEEAAASIVRYLGRAEASAMIAERMREVARRSEDPVMVSLAAFQRAHAALACGAWDNARAIATRHIADLSVRVGPRRGGAELRGMLMLTAAFAYIGAGARHEAATHIEAAKKLAKQTGDTMTLSLFFGPTNVSIWELSIEVDSGDPARAVALARAIDPTRVPQVQRQATYHVDTARALWHLGRDDDAIHMLMEAERLAPVQAHADPRVVQIVRNIVERQQRNDAREGVQAFCRRLGVAL